MEKSLNRPIIGQDDKKEISKNKELESFLYDLDLLPEQLDGQPEVTVGLIAAYNRFFGIMISYKYMKSIKK